MSKRKFYICDNIRIFTRKKKSFFVFLLKSVFNKMCQKVKHKFSSPPFCFLNQFLSLRYYDICKIIYLRVERIGSSLPKSALFYICDLLDMFLLL